MLVNTLVSKPSTVPHVLQQTPLYWLRISFQGVRFSISVFLFIVRDLLYFGDILIKINILVSYYNVCNNYGTLGQDLGKLPTSNILLTLLEKALVFCIHIIIIKMSL